MPCFAKHWLLSQNNMGSTDLASYPPVLNSPTFTPVRLTVRIQRSPPGPDQAIPLASLGHVGDSRAGAFPPDSPAAFLLASCRW